ncbi:MAG: N-acetyltransferase [Kiritimatiellales bacterium]
MDTLTIRSAVPADLPALESVENRCFTASRRSSRRALQHSLHSPAQEVLIAVTKTGGVRQIAGAMTLHIHMRTVRIYSIAVLPAFRGSGIGKKLIHRAITVARRRNRNAVSLEADRRNRRLIRWYESFGFETGCVLKDYYAPGRAAVRMRLTLETAPERELVYGRA